jgi:hypothetical protein
MAGAESVRARGPGGLRGLGRIQPPRPSRPQALTPLTITVALCLGATAALAQESPAQWIARIFDPAALGITQFPGATLNKKQSVDAIVLERGGDKRIAVFLIPPDQAKAAAEHFAKQFGVPAEVTGADSRFETYTFDFTGASTAPAKFAGLRVRISRAEFADNKAQITMEYSPPKGK